MFLTRISINNPVFAAMVMVALLVVGLFSYQRLPVEQFPSIDMPIVAVVVSYQGASPEAVENDIVKPIEDGVATLSGLDSIQSTAQSGRAQVILTFSLEIDAAKAIQDVRDQMASVEANFPAAADKAQILRFDPAASPIVSLAVSSNSRSPQSLTSLAEDIISNHLRNIEGVGSVAIVGGVPGQIDVLVDPVRLDAYSIAMSDVLSALQQNNADFPAGTLVENGLEQSVEVKGKVEDIAGFKRIIIARRGGEPVYLSDVASIREGVAEDESLAFLNGQRALAVDIQKVQGANTVEVAHEVLSTIDRLMQRDLPADVKIDVVRNNAVDVEHSLAAVQNMMIEGAILSIVIVFLFLNSWRSTVITGLTLPISLIGTMVALNFFGFTLNMMTLMALSLSVGIVIDDAIVVRENIMRHLHMGKSHRRAALEGTKEIGLAVLATTLSIVAVFLPVAFMEGIMGRFFLQFGVTVSVAVLLSLFVAFTLDPMLSSIWYDPDAHPGNKRGPLRRLIAQFDRFFEWIAKGYQAVLRWSLRHRIATLLVTLALFVSSFAFIPQVGVEFLPGGDNSELQVELETPTGSSLAYTAAKVLQAEKLLQAMPEVTRTYVTLNANSTNAASMVVSLVPTGERDLSSQELAVPVRAMLVEVAGLDAVVGTVSGLGTVSKPVQIIIYGEDFATLRGIGETIGRQLEQIDGIKDVESSLSDGRPMIGIKVDATRASEMGISMQQIGNALLPMLSGDIASEWTAPNGDTYDLVVRLPQEARNQLETLVDLPIGQGMLGEGEGLVRLGQIAEISRSAGPSEIVRQDLDRRVIIDANIEGVLGDVSGEVDRIIAETVLPDGYRFGVGGDAEMLGDAGSSAISALTLAVVFIYLVLASQFGSLLQPLAIMVSLPLSLMGVVLGLIVGGSTLNMMSMIGFIMLMGLVVKNAILLVDNANQRRAEGTNLFDALVEAGGIRFRPIVMTTLAMILGMLPLALNLHEGSSQNAPMAHAVIGGLISSTILTLVVVPVLLTYVDSFGRFVARFLPKAPVDDEADGPALLPAPSV